MSKALDELLSAYISTYESIFELLLTAERISSSIKDRLLHVQYVLDSSEDIDATEQSIVEREVIKESFKRIGSIVEGDDILIGGLFHSFYRFSDMILFVMDLEIRVERVLRQISSSYNMLNKYNEPDYYGGINALTASLEEKRKGAYELVNMLVKADAVTDNIVLILSDKELSFSVAERGLKRAREKRVEIKVHSDALRDLREIEKEWHRYIRAMESVYDTINQEILFGNINEVDVSLKDIKTIARIYKTQLLFRSNIEKMLTDLLSKESVLAWGEYHDSYIHIKRESMSFLERMDKEIAKTWAVLIQVPEWDILSRSMNLELD